MLDELAALAEEHVLGPAQPDALGAEPTGAGGVRRGVRVGADLQAAVLVGVLDEAGDGADQLVLAAPLVALEPPDHERVLDRDLALEDLAGRAVDRDHVALVDDVSPSRVVKRPLPRRRRRASRRRRRRCGPCRGRRRRRATSCRRAR